MPYLVSDVTSLIDVSMMFLHGQGSLVRAPGLCRDARWRWILRCAGTGVRRNCICCRKHLRLVNRWRLHVQPANLCRRGSWWWWRVFTRWRLIAKSYESFLDDLRKFRGCYILPDRFWINFPLGQCWSCSNANIVIRHSWISQGAIVVPGIAAGAVNIRIGLFEPLVIADSLGLEIRTGNPWTFWLQVLVRVTVRVHAYPKYDILYPREKLYGHRNVLFGGFRT